MTRRVSSFVVAGVLAASLHALVDARQSPHGGRNTPLQPGPNVNAAGGIADPKDPAALVKADLNQQRQNETVAAASVRNPDHILAAANDYRFVDFPQDQFFGGGQSFIARLIARLLGRPVQRTPARAAASVGAWTGVYRSCDRGRSWIGGAVPGGPLDFSEAAQQSPLKQFSNLAATQGGHAETTDPVLVAGPSGRMHLVVVAFVRFPNGAVGESRMYYVSYTDRNNREGGTCFNYDFTREIDRSTNYRTNRAPAPFIDKPSVAVDKDGTLYAAYTTFLDSVNSRIVVARSTDGGATWTRTSPLLNLGFLRNHGTAIAIDPLSGTVYVAWRVFYDDWPLMVISKSFNRGRTFLPATPISHLWPSRSIKQIVSQLRGARLQPFDQFSPPHGAPPAARALAFPSIAVGVVNGRSKVFAAWTERADVTPGSPTFGQPNANGSPRVMFSMSSDGGWNWTTRRAIDAGPRTEHSLQPGLGMIATRPSGPQIQPVLSLTGLSNPQLLLLYYESRDELDQPFAASFISGIERLADVRAARIDPVAGALLAPSIQVSQYPIETNSSPAELAEIAPGYRVGNRQNLTIYGGGHDAFLGDYPHLSPSIPFEYRSGWGWAGEPGTTVAIWTDHRDVAFPIGADGLPDLNGPWPDYVAIVPALPGSPPPAACSNVASRDANPYFAEIGGVVAGAPQTFKRLTIQRAFATYVENRTAQDRFFRLTIQDNEAAGVDGSFDQFDFRPATDSVDVRIFANSSHHRTVWVQPLPSNPTASLRILVREITAMSGSLKADGLRSRIILNPDPDNDAPTTVPPLDPEHAGNPALTADNSELHNPQISTPQISTFRISAPQISSPQISTPQISTSQVATPQISTPQISTPQISSPQISTPQISTVTPEEAANGTDVTYTVTNAGTTWTTYEALFNVPNVEALIGSGNYQFQLLVTRTSLVPGFRQSPDGCEAAAKTQVQVITNIPVPQISSPQISTIQNPQISTPQISTPQISTFSVAPFGGVEGQNSHGDDGNEDHHSTTLPDEVKVTIRAIRLKTLAAIRAEGGPEFTPTEVELRVESKSTNVVLGVVEPDGSQPAVVTDPDLVVANYVPASPALTAAAGSDVALSAFAFRNQGNGAVNLPPGSIGIGYYLSSDPVITAADTLLASASAGGLPAGAEVPFAAPTVTIPIGTLAGSYYVGVLVDTLNAVAESNELNNYASEPIVVMTPVCLTPPANLVAWWPGDGDPNDIVGGNHGIPNGVAFPDDHVDRVFDFDGENDVVRILEDASLRPEHITVDFWFRSAEPLDAGAAAPLLAMMNDGDDAFGPTTKGYSVYYQAGQLVFELRRASNGAPVPLMHPVTFPAEEWHHVAGTYDGRFQRLYLDGVEVAVRDWQTEELGTAGYGTPADVLLGKITFREEGAGPTFSVYFSGQLDEIEIFSRALTPAEVLSLFAIGTLGKCKPVPAPGPLFFVVTNTNDSGAGSLRQALLDANANAGQRDTVVFNIPGAGPHVIPVPTALPEVTEPVVINGRSQLGYTGTPLIRLNNTGGAGATGLRISAGTSQISALSITGFGGSGIELLTGGSNVVDGNYIGLWPDGTTGGPNGVGILVTSGLNMIGGTSTPERNVISLNSVRGVDIRGVAANANRVINNYIGTSASGLAARGNATQGVLIADGASANVVGEPGAGNVISGNARGVSIGPATTNNFVFANVIGTTPDGLAALSNTELGIAVFGDGNFIGGAGPGGGNLISGNGTGGVLIWRALGGTASGNFVRGNTIGLAADGQTMLGNGPVATGVKIQGGSSNTIGDSAPGSRNVISGNSGYGVEIVPSADTPSTNTIANNLIGTDVSGDLARPNVNGGISIADSPDNIVRGNVISGNGGPGVLISGGVDFGGNRIQGNRIGTDSGGMDPLGNAGAGVALGAPALVGGDTPDVGNLISGNGGGGIVLGGDDNASTIQQNFIGTNAPGTAAIGNVGNGISISDTEFTVIGGTAPLARNVISGNTLSGIQLANDASLTTIQGNFIGTDASGASPIGNGAHGIHVVEVPSTQIGGASASARNVLSGNGAYGIRIIGEDSTNNVIEGNYIGTDVQGTADVGNGLSGVLLGSGAHGNRIGGAAAAGNLISGNNGNGVLVLDGADNLIQGNRIGTNAAGTAAIGNGPPGGGSGSFGIAIDAPATTIGGNLAGLGNLISGNPAGVDIASGSEGTIVAGNQIGTDVTGTLPIPNQRGIVNRSAAIVIGGLSAASRNQISGNALTGILIQAPATGVSILGNYVGTTSTGGAALPNGEDGIRVQPGASAIIGGDRLSGAQNIIAGNALAGVRLESNGNSVLGNNIGTGAQGELTVGNGQAGMAIAGSENVVGGTGNLYNVIGRNGADGVAVIGASAIRNAITDNVMFGNAGLAIDLGDNGVTANDTGDGDPGPNELQNFPVLTSVTSDGSMTRVQGTLNSTADTAITLRFFRDASCDPSGHGEAQFILGSAIVATVGNDATFDVVLPVASPIGHAVSATATGPLGSTSELSVCGLVAEPAPVAAARGYVVHQTNPGTVSGFDSSLTLVASIPVGADPFDIALNPAGTRAYVTNEGSGTVSVINTATNMVIDTIAGMAAPAGIVVNPAGTRAYVADSTGPLHVLDLVSNAVIASVPAGEGLAGIDITPDGQRVYAVDRLTSQVVILDTTANEVIGTIEVGLFPLEIAVSQAPFHNRAYVTNSGAGTVSVIETSGNTVIGTIAVGAGPTGIVLPPEGTFAYVANTLSNTISRIDTASQTVETTFAAPGSPTMLGLTDSGLLASAATGSAIHVIRTEDDGFDATVPTAASPAGIAIKRLQRQTFTVTNTNDGGAGSLRAAIEAANESEDTLDTIDFAIPGGGVKTISPTSPLPEITDPVIVDGLTQGGGFSIPLLIELDGTNAGPNANGIWILDGNSVVRGLAVNRFGTGGAGLGGAGVVLQGGRTRLESNLIGTDPTGVSARPNRTDGVWIDSPGNRLGDVGSGFNFISGNGRYGVVITGPSATKNQIVNNRIGVSISHAPLGNAQGGVAISGASSNVVGGASASGIDANIIGSNGGDGIEITGPSDGNHLRFNMLRDNGGLGIDLNNDGVTANDPGDGDVGPNQRQNFPVITSASEGGGQLRARGTLNSTPSTAFVLRFYVNEECDPSGHGEASQLVGELDVTTDASGNHQFDASFVATAPRVGFFMSATATHAATGDTSELAACRVVVTSEVPAGFTHLWLGGTPTNPTAWAEAGNWSPAAVPGPADNVYIQATDSDPVISASVSVNKILVADNAQMSNGGFSLRTVTVATDALVVGGGHIAARVIMTGTGVTNVDADGLQINATANVTLSGDTDVDGGLTVLGALTLGGFPLTVEGSLLVDGANGLLRMITFGDALTVEGPAVFRGASTIGSLTHGIATFMSHFEQRSTFSGASYAPVAAHTTVLQASPTQVTFDSPGFVGTTSHFHHLRIDGLPAAIQMNTDVMVTGMLTVTAPAFGGPASFNGVGGPRNLVVSGLDVAQLNLQDVYLTAVMGSTLTRFDNVSSVNAAAAGSMVTIESNGLAAPFTMNNLSFGPAVGTMRYLTVNDLGGPAVATNIVLVGANPANGCALSAISGNASITWNGNVCF